MDFEIKVQTPVRLDVYLAQLYPELPRAYIQKGIKQGKVMVNAKATTKPSYQVKSGDLVEAVAIDKAIEIPKIEMKIIFEDNDVVVIDKPVGLLSHSKGVINPEATVATWLADKYRSSVISNRDGIVHRLDRATSGVMICAKNAESLKWLQKQFSSRKVKKTYQAIVQGNMDPPEAVIDMPIERNPKVPQRFRAGHAGKPATTYYRQIKEIKKGPDKYALVILHPKTGRTHQLRVHLSYIGHPIVGDTFYRGQYAKRLFLHAKELEIMLPDGNKKIFQAPTPKEFLEFER